MLLTVFPLGLATLSPPLYMPLPKIPTLTFIHHAPPKSQDAKSLQIFTGDAVGCLRFGSGRGQVGRDITNDYRSHDVRLFQRDGVLAAGRSFTTSWMRNGKAIASIQVKVEADRVILDYRHQSNGGEWKLVNYPVRIEWTPCNYGGYRAWFRCPADGCIRRVAKLFLGSSGIFACRHCYKLAYASQRETDDDQAMRRADTIRRRLGWEAGIANPV